MKKKLFIFFFFIFSSVNIFSVAPTSKNANKANRYLATMKRIEENFDGDKFSEMPYPEAFFPAGRMIHFVEVLKPVFEDLYNNGVAGISLEDVEYLKTNYEGFLEVKSMFEMMLYNFDVFLISQLIENGYFSDKLGNFSYDEILNLSLGEFFEMYSLSEDGIDEIKKYFSKYKNFSDDELANISFLEFFLFLLESDEMKKETGFDLTEIKKWRAEYERGLSYDKIEFD